MAFTAPFLFALSTCTVGTAHPYTTINSAVSSGCTIINIDCPSGICTYTENIAPTSATLDLHKVGAGTVVIDGGSLPALTIDGTQTILDGIDELTGVSGAIVEIKGGGTLSMTGSPGQYAYIRGVRPNTTGVSLRGDAFAHFNGVSIDSHSTGLELTVLPNVNAPSVELEASVLASNDLALKSGGCATCTQPSISVFSKLLMGSPSTANSYIADNDAVLETRVPTQATFSHVLVFRNAALGGPAVPMVSISDGSSLVLENTLVDDNDLTPGTDMLGAAPGNVLFELHDGVAQINVINSTIARNTNRPVFDWSFLASPASTVLVEGSVITENDRPFSHSKLPGSACGNMNVANTIFFGNTGGIGVSYPSPPCGIPFIAHNPGLQRVFFPIPPSLMAPFAPLPGAPEAPYLEQWTPFAAPIPFGPATLYPGPFMWGINGAGPDTGNLDVGYHWGT